MRIIKMGTIIPKTTVEICYKCGTEFEYEGKDVKNDRDGDYVNCPVCNAFISSSKMERIILPVVDPNKVRLLNEGVPPKNNKKPKK